ncbi:hypothetical protein M0R45_024140 [Rubus argutus]|uniref:DCD domain-containing protein n=1 Tax=Rubus argutus TaxID=59490 RepID=A0AAW1WQP8_RUBAR
MENNNQSFWQFSDQLRVQTSNLANLSVNDSIWSNSYGSKRPDARRNFDIKVGGEVNSLINLTPKGSDFNEGGVDYKQKGSDLNGSNDGWNSFKPKASELNGFSDRWNSFKPKASEFNAFNPKVQTLMGLTRKFRTSMGLTRKFRLQWNNNSNKKKAGDDNNKDIKGDKKFKTLPPSESLPRNETIGGYIFVCNNDTMQENLKRQLFGLPPRYRDSVRAITPGLPLFLYNYSTHQLHGIFEAASFGGTNFDPSAWEDKKCPGESRFPAQVRVLTRKVCEPLEEDSFRPILHHYDGPKFRLELSVPEALSLLDIFADQDDIFVAETP